MKDRRHNFHLQMALVCLMTPALLFLDGRMAAQDSDSAPEKQQGSATALAFKDFFEPGTKELKPTRLLLSLKGKRVRISGFMVEMETPPRGGFYITSRPVFCDEAGAGTADLPAASVYVIVRSAKDKEVPFIAGPIEVTGTLDLDTGPGNGGDSHHPIRLVLDGPAEPQLQETNQNNKNESRIQEEK